MKYPRLLTAVVTYEVYTFLMLIFMVVYQPNLAEHFMNEKVFKVGSKVVYPSHGIGQIVEIEDQTLGDVKMQFLVIYFEKDKLNLRVPLKRAHKVGVRTLSSRKDMDGVLEILAEKPKINRGIWSKRAMEYETKIHSGSLVSIAEVIRDLFKGTNTSDRSYSEKVIYDLALSRLSSEYAVLHKLDQKIALEKILELIRDRQAA
jgi:CarD family transcriptional regulator